jgi:hypothetical protein
VILVGQIGPREFTVQEAIACLGEPIGDIENTVS